MSNISMEITLHDFDEFGDCKANVSLPDSGLLIKDLVVKQGPGNGVMVHMAKWMHGHWSFPEVSWADVRQAVTQEYRCTPHTVRMFSDDLIVRLHSFDSTDACLADVSIPQRQITVQNLKVLRCQNGGVQVYMPGGTNSCWNIPNISWAQVRKTVSAEFCAALEKRRISGVHLGEWTIPQNISIPQFRFHSFKTVTEADVDLEIPEFRISIPGIHISASSPNMVSIRFPFQDSEPWPYPQIPRAAVFDMLQADFIHTLLQANAVVKPDQIVVQYRRSRTVVMCLVDLSLPGRRVLTGFRLREEDNGTIYLKTPPTIGEWKDPKYPWPMLKRMVEVTYLEQKSMLSKGLGEMDSTPEMSMPSKQSVSVPDEAHDKSNTHTETASPANGTTVSNESEFVAAKQEKNRPDHPSRPKNEYGRVDNAENSPFRFFPRTVLRKAEIRQKPNSRLKGGLMELVNAMSMGEKGGIGPFELSVTEWISRLRYVTSAMLMDLVKGGYINVGWRHNINLNRMDDVILRMARYDLLVPTQFVTLSEDGTSFDNTRSNVRILTLGAAGKTLLYELGQDDARYNAFDIYRDGNSVKRYLSSNQFLIYWLIHYPDLIGKNFYPAIPVFWRGSEYVGAWFYATVTLGDHVLVGECIRRVEDFEIAHHCDVVRNKLERTIEILSHPDELYTGRYKTEPIAFVSRPIIVLICEDDEHIQYVREMFSDIISQHLEQEVWFTTDLRIFNNDMRHQRFIKIENEQFTIVDIGEELELVEDY